MERPLASPGSRSRTGGAGRGGLRGERATQIGCNDLARVFTLGLALPRPDRGAESTPPSPRFEDLEWRSRPRDDDDRRYRTSFFVADPFGVRDSPFPLAAPKKRNQLLEESASDRESVTLMFL